MSNQSIKRKVEKLEEALYACREPEIVEQVLDRAIARVDEQALKHIHGALVRDAFGRQDVAFLPSDNTPRTPPLSQPHTPLVGPAQSPILTEPLATLSQRRLLQAVSSYRV